MAREKYDIWSVYFGTSHLLGLFDEVIKNIKESTGYEIADSGKYIVSISCIYYVHVYIQTGTYSK